MMLEKWDYCPNCGTGLVQDEYDTQRCGKCGWIRDAKPKEAPQPERKAPRMLVEFTRTGGDGPIAINAPAVAYVSTIRTGPDELTAVIAISGKEADVIYVTEPYDEVVDALQTALEGEP